MTLYSITLTLPRTLTCSQQLKQAVVVLEGMKSCVCVLRVDDVPAPRGYMSAMMVDKPEDMIFYNHDFMKQYHDAPNNNKNTVPSHGYFAKLASFEEEHCEKGELYMEYRKMPCQEKNGELCEYCRATDFVSSSSATPSPRPYPDYSKLPDFHYLPGTKHQRLAANLMIISLEPK